MFRQIPFVPESRRRFTYLITLLAFCIGAAFISSYYLGVDIIYTHLFYLPIVLGALWYYKKALWLAALLGLIHIGINYLVIGEFVFNAVLRSLVFLLIAYVVGSLAEKQELFATELKQSRDQLNEEKREKTLILENLTELVTYQDREQRIIWANPAAANSFDMRPEEFLGIKCYEAWQNRQTPCEGCPVRQALDLGEVCRGEVNFPGGRCWSITGSPVRNERGEVVGAVETALEITEQKNAAAEIIKLNEELEERVRNRTAELVALNKELDAFSYSVSHDLRAPLRSIDGFSQALLEDYGESLDEQGRDYLVRVCDSSKRMGELIDDLLKLSHVTRLEMSREKVDLSELARSCLEKLQDHEPQRQVQIMVAPGISAVGDASLLRIALENLLGNAWKFTSGVELARIEVGTTTESGQFVCFIRDNGAGFNMAYENKLFKAFQRLHDSEAYRGTGIGLSIVARIIQRHGGDIWALGEVGKGAAFYFTLPHLTLNQDRGD